VGIGYETGGEVGEGAVGTFRIMAVMAIDGETLQLAIGIQK